MPEVKGIFTDEPRNEGEIAQNSNNQHISTKAIKGNVKFGRAVMTGDDPQQVALYSGDNKIFKGVAAISSDGKLEKAEADLEPQELPGVIGYKEGDVGGICEEGFIVVQVNEAVDLDSPVRVINDITVPASAGYQEFEFTEPKALGDASGLANDATSYSFLVSLGGAPGATNVIGNLGQTIGDVIDQMNTNLPGATASLVGGNIRITRDITGVTSEIGLTTGGAGTDITTVLEDFDQFGDAVLGEDAVIEPSEDDGSFTSTAIAGNTTLIKGAKFASKTDGPGKVWLELGGRTVFESIDD